MLNTSGGSHNVHVALFSELVSWPHTKTLKYGFRNAVFALVSSCGRPRAKVEQAWLNWILIEKLCSRRCRHIETLPTGARLGPGRW